MTDNLKAPVVRRQVILVWWALVCPHLIGEVEASFGAAYRRDNGQVPVLTCNVQRRVAMAILLVQVAVVSEEAADHVNLTPPYGQVERCVAVLDTHTQIGVLITLSVAPRSALCSTRHSTMSAKPRAEAVSSGLSPSRFLASTWQPAWQRARATGEYPCHEAQCSGVSCSWKRRGWLGWCTDSSPHPRCHSAPPHEEQSPLTGGHNRELTSKTHQQLLEEEWHLIHLILDIQRTFLFMEEFQGLHVAMSRCVVDSVGSTLKVTLCCIKRRGGERQRGEVEGGEEERLMWGLFCQA
ncbi:hypothetical protein F7725_013195 [Dissostichus mawsoni]|uniref:Secreted protein n=1 Tax=Dissostichus mawsoni TaxID=36200 RepID=A0A7J5YQN2_DISMA|nr:hypothetical protein F7725_013195 [Dissostichus mawsoni]